MLVCSCSLPTQHNCCWIPAPRACSTLVSDPQVFKVWILQSESRAKQLLSALEQGRLYQEYSPLEDMFYRFIAVKLGKSFSHGCQQLIWVTTIKTVVSYGTCGRGVSGRGPGAPAGVRCPGGSRSHGRHLAGAGARLGTAPRSGRGMGSVPGLEGVRNRRGAGMQQVTDVQSCSTNNKAASHFCPRDRHQSLAQHTETLPGAESRLHCFILDRVKESCGPLFQRVSPRTNFKYTSRHWLLFIDFALTTETTLVLAHRNTGPVEYCQHMLCRKKL